MLQTHEDCLVYLEKIRWKGTPTCPYCGSTKQSKYKSEQRYRCNSCFTSYSVTVGTLFHKTHVDLTKWFEAIYLLQSLKGDISIRQLAREIQVSRAAAASMMDRIRDAQKDEVEMIQQISAMKDDPEMGKEIGSDRCFEGQGTD